MPKFKFTTFYQLALFQFILFFCLSNKTLLAQDNGEIQVYGSATTPKYTTMIELHSNYTLTGPKYNSNYHPFLQTLEVTTGLSKDAELGFYIFTFNNNGKTQYTGSHIRPRIKAPEKWEWPIGVSLSTEIGFDKDPFTNEMDWSHNIAS